MPRTSVEITSHVPLDAGDDLTGGLALDRDLERHVAGQGVRGAAEAGVVGTERHLDHVQRTLTDLGAALDQAFGGLLQGHRDGGVVVGGADDEVDVGDHALLVGLVVVVERAARRLDHTDALAHDARGDVAHVGVDDLGVSGQLVGALGCVQQLHKARPVRRQGGVHRLAAQRGEVTLVLLLSERGGHAVGSVEAAERRGAVDAGVLAVDEAFPADALEVRVHEVAVRLDVLGDVRQVVAAVELLEFGAVRAGDTDLAVVEVHLVVLVDHAHVVGGMREGVALDEVDVVVVGEHHVVEELQAELGELHHAGGDLHHAVALLSGDRRADAAGQATDRVDLLAADHADELGGLGAQVDHGAAGLETDLVDHAEDVARRRVGLGAHDEVRAGEDVEVGGVVGHVERVVEQLAQHAAGGRDLDAEHCVDGLGGRHMVSFRAHAADARRDARQLLYRAADAEAFEAAQLGDLEVDVGHLAGVVHEDLDLAVALEPGDGIDCYLFHLDPRPPEQRIGEPEAVEGTHRVRHGRRDLGDLLGRRRIDDGGHGAEHLGALVDNALGGAVAAAAGHAHGGAARAAACLRGRSHADQALFEQALLCVGDELPDAPEAADLFLFLDPLALLAAGLGGDADGGALRRQLALALERGGHDVEHRRDLVRLGRATRHEVVHVDGLREGLHGVVHMRQHELALGHRVPLLRIHAVGIVDRRIVAIHEVLDLLGAGHVGEALVLAVADAAVEQADVDEAVVVALDVLVLEVGGRRPKDHFVVLVDLDDLVLDLEEGDLAAAAAAGPVHGELELAHAGTASFAASAVSASALSSLNWAFQPSGPRARICSVNSVTTRANLSPSAAETHSRRTRPCSRPSCSRSFSVSGKRPAVR